MLTDELVEVWCLQHQLSEQAKTRSNQIAYNLEQATYPQTLSYGMMDSPVGTAAWNLEKFYHWSDRRERTFESIFTRDQLLTEVMIYLVTRTFNTATWIYAG